MIQPYVGDEPTEEMNDAVRGIAGEELDIIGSRHLRFSIGNRQYNHNFVVAPFAIKKDGIIGLDLLKTLGARIDLITEEVELDGQKIPFTKQLSPEKENVRQQVRASRTEPVTQRHNQEETIKTPETVKEPKPLEVKTTERIPSESNQTELQQAERKSRDNMCGQQIEPQMDPHTWLAVLPQPVRLEPRSIVVTRAKIVDQQHRIEPKTSIKGWAYAEPIEIPHRGIYSARTVSKIFTSSDLVDITRRTVHWPRKNLDDASTSGQRTKETTYCTAQLVNTSQEGITLPAGTRIADIHDAKEDDVIEYIAEDEGNYPHVLKTNKYPRHLDPQVKEQNANVPRLLEDKLTHLTQKEKNIIRPALMEYQDLFKKTEEGKIPRTDFGYHEIDTGSAAPIKRNPYRIPYALRDELKNQIDEMVRKGVLTKAATEYSAPVILIRKKSTDGTTKYRFCADFRGLNAVTKIPVFCMPLVQENLDRLNGNQYFSFVDLKDAYYHIEIKPEDKHKTGIVTPFGTYQYERLAFGLAGSPYTFTRVMDEVLMGLGNITCLVFMDDILIFGRSMQEHTERLREVFERLRTAKLTLNLEKCHFAKDSVEYLGHCVTRAGVKPSQDKVKAIREYPRPRNVTEVRSFLGLSGYYRQYIPRYAEISQPLTQLTRKDHKFCWDRAQEEAFNRLKTEISSDTVLAYPSMDHSHEFRLHTDASDHGISAVLTQVQEGKERPISYASRQLNATERNLTVTEKELLAVVYGTKQFRCYLYGRKFTLVTDHRALCWLLKLRDPSAKLTRWALRLSEFEYTVEHRPGKHHLVPDALSRHIATISTEGTVTRSEVKAEQDLDGLCRKIRENLEGQSSYMMDEDGLLYRKDPDGQPRIVVPEKLVNRLIRDHHDAKHAAHAGVRRTQQWMRLRYYWPRLHRDVEDYVLSCDKCSRLKSGRTNIAPMGTLPEAREPGEVASIDITGPYATSRKGNKYLLTYIDHFTKWVEAIPLADQEATTVASALVTQIFTRHGVCDKLLSDRGRNFTSELMKETCRLLGVDKLFTSPYRPQCNGQVERFHRTLHAGLAMYTDHSGTNWDDNVNYVLWAYRSQPQSSTGFSPFHLMHGTEMKGPLDRDLEAYERRNRKATDVKGNVARLAARLRQARRIARRKMNEVKTEQRARHDKRAKKIEFRPGQLVYRKQMKKGRKLDARWLGPYQILRKVSDWVYTIQIGRKEINLNVEQLKLCRATREELRERRRLSRRRNREQRPRPEPTDESDSENESSSDSEDQTAYTTLLPEHLRMNETDCYVSESPAGAEEREDERSDGDSASDTGHGQDTPAACDNVETEPISQGYALRPRVKRNYKE